jgi:hypothetical protein
VVVLPLPVGPVTRISPPEEPEGHALAVQRGDGADSQIESLAGRGRKAPPPVERLAPFVELDVRHGPQVGQAADSLLQAERMQRADHPHDAHRHSDGTLFRRQKHVAGAELAGMLDETADKQAGRSVGAIRFDEVHRR